MSCTGLSWAMKIAVNSTSERLVLMLLADTIPDLGEWFAITENTINSMLDCSVLDFDCFCNVLNRLSSAGTLHCKWGDEGSIEIILQPGIYSSSRYRTAPNPKRYIPVKRKVRNEVMEKYEYKCVWCGTQKNLSIDHILPRSRGGKDDIQNLSVACRSCNTRKGSKTAEEFTEWLKSREDRNQ